VGPDSGRRIRNGKPQVEDGARKEIQEMKRGEIYWCDIEPRRGHEQGARRPVIIVSADPYNQSRSPLIGVVPLTTATAKNQSRSRPAHDPGDRARLALDCSDRPRPLPRPNPPVNHPSGPPRLNGPSPARPPPGPRPRL